MDRRHDQPRARPALGDRQGPDRRHPALRVRAGLGRPGARPLSPGDLQRRHLPRWRGQRAPQTGLLARVNALETNVQVFKVENGRRVPLMAGVHHEIPTNAWSILKVSARGNRFQVYVDHRRIMQGWDNTFLTGGKVGLWTVADSVTYFDDFRINPR